MSKPVSNFQWSPAPEIAYETVDYAVSCLMLADNKSLAIDVVNEENNGLTPQQKTQLTKSIRDLSERPKTVREMNQLQNRLIGVLQPATVQFLETPKALATVLNHASRDQWQFPISEFMKAFAIQIPAEEIRQAFMHELSQKETLDFFEIYQLVDLLQGPDVMFLFFEDQDEENLREISAVLDFCPNFHTFKLTKDADPNHLKLLGKALKARGEKSKFKTVVIDKDVKNWASLISYLPPFAELQFTEGVEDDLEVTVPPDGLHNLQHLVKKDLTSLQLQIHTPCENREPKLLPFDARHRELLKSLPIASLDLSGAYLSDASGFQHFEIISELTSLRKLELYYSSIRFLDFEKIQILTRKLPLLRTIGLDPVYTREWSQRLTIKTLKKWQDWLPHVTLQNSEGVPYSQVPDDPHEESY